MVYAKRPFAGPKAVLAYLARYTYRVAISNSRLIRLDDKGVTFRWKDYRARGKTPGKAWIKPMTLDAAEFIRRFPLHVLPSGFHRIRQYGQSSFDRCERLAPAHRRHRKQPRSSLPLQTLSAARCRRLACQPVRDPQIPIGALRQTVPLPPRGFLLGKLSSADPGRSPTSQRAGTRNPSP